jgi:hypothetical protein
MGAKKKPANLIAFSEAILRESAHRDNPNALCLACGNPHYDHEYLLPYEIEDINEGREEEHCVRKCEHAYNEFKVEVAYLMMEETDHRASFCYIPLAPPGDPADEDYMRSIST